MALIQHLQLLVPEMKVDGRDAETILFYSIEPWYRAGGKGLIIVNHQKLAEQHLENSKKVVEEALQHVCGAIN
jgi:hypothetical protein|tara:strand:- start:15027 stop:15245 length:219 start_codon:yes stop_codon:yes gene_type:complete